MREQHIPKDNRYEGLRLAEGYWIGSLDPDLPDPDFIFRGMYEESFDIRDRDFANIDRVFGYFPSQILEHMMRTRQLPIDVLDIGGGPESVASRQLAQRHPETIRAVNVDVVLSSRHNQNTQNFRSLCEDVCSMSLPDASIDFVYSWQMAYGLRKPRKQKMLEQVVRVLKPGGVALVDEDDLRLLSPSDPRLGELSNLLSISAFLRNGNLRQFLMLMKPPIVSEIVGMKRKTKT